MSQYKVSVIVPVYNVEKYLCKCIESVIGQTFENWEMLLIDDGSTDSSGLICDEYSQKDARIKVYHKTNKGVSQTRNFGLKRAAGDWILFLDSDDELYPYSLDFMLKWSSKVDMVIGVYKIIRENSKEKKCDFDAKRIINKKVSARKVIRYMMDANTNFQRGISPKLYKLNIINTHNLIFDEKLYYAEDQLFFAKYICCEEVHAIHVNNTIPVYMYNIWDGNATSTYEKSFNKKSVTEFYGFYKIYQIYHNRFNNKKIDLWSKLNVYISGRLLLKKIDTMINVPVSIKNSIEDGLSSLIDRGGDKAFIGVVNLMEMKEKAKALNTEERVSFINQWLHSTQSVFFGLPNKWKMLYLLSHLFGKSGIKLIINKITF